jgi:hypothetical protein
MQVTQEDARIELRYERGGRDPFDPYGWKTAARGPTPHRARLLGRALGGDVLTIETTHLESRVVFTTRGYPLSPETRITERYSRDADNDLHMELVIEDPCCITATRPSFRCRRRTPSNISVTPSSPPF